MMKKGYVLAFILGLTIVCLFGFTRDWDEANPTNSTVANQIDEYNRYLRVDTSDRLENMFYGFIAGENTLSQHCQYLQFYEQASVSQPSAGYGRLYTKAVGGKCELFWQDEDADEPQLTSGGKWNGAVLLAASIPSGSYAADSIDSADYAASSIDLEHMSANSVDSDQYVDGSIDPAHIGTILTAFSSTSVNDSDGSAMLKDHAYLAQTDGFVTVYITLTNNEDRVYLDIDDDDNPAADSIVRLGQEADAATSEKSVSSIIPNGMYFEVTCSTGTPTINWISIGTETKPADQD